jgi:hypothetical protein
LGDGSTNSSTFCALDKEAAFSECLRFRDLWSDVVLIIGSEVGLRYHDKRSFSRTALQLNTTQNSAPDENRRFDIFAIFAAELQIYLSEARGHEHCGP